MRDRSGREMIKTPMLPTTVVNLEITEFAELDDAQDVQPSQHVLCPFAQR